MKIFPSVVLILILGIAAIIQLCWIAFVVPGFIVASSLYFATAIACTILAHVMTEKMKGLGGEVGGIARRMRQEKSILFWHMTNLAYAIFLFLISLLVRRYMADP